MLLSPSAVHAVCMLCGAASAATCSLGTQQPCDLCHPHQTTVNGLTKSTLEAIRASLALEELLLEAAGAEGGAQPPPWGTMERLSPLLYTWAQARARGVWGCGSRFEGGWLVGAALGQLEDGWRLAGPHGPGHPLACADQRCPPPALARRVRAGPDQHAGRVDGPNSKRRGLVPRLQAARAWLAVGGRGWMVGRAGVCRRVPE